MLHEYTGLVTSVYVTDEDDIAVAKSLVGASDDNEVEPEFEQWNEQRIRQYLTAGPSRSIISIDGFIIDVTEHLSSHVRPFVRRRSFWCKSILKLCFSSLAASPF